MITEDYVSFEIAKLLKEKGFKAWCRCCYGFAILHNGEDISFDEECELKDEGRENEIEYVEGGRLYDYSCNNGDEVTNVWAAPTLQMAMKWLRENRNIHCDIGYDDCNWFWNIISVDKNVPAEDRPLLIKDGLAGYKTYEEACEAAIKYCLENLI